MNGGVNEGVCSGHFRIGAVHGLANLPYGNTLEKVDLLLYQRLRGHLITELTDNYQHKEKISNGQIDNLTDTGITRSSGKD